MSVGEHHVLSAAEVSRVSEKVLTEIERAVIGKRDVLELIWAALLANGHVLLDDVPGVAKTLTARSFASVLGLEFARVQFTVDLMPADVTGALVLDLGTNDVRFRHGPIFTQVLLADEINRAPAKTQAALLEAMQEHQVTIDGTSRPLPSPFLVIGTQNPIESDGTYPLPEAQLDRFMIRTSIGYPDQIDEVQMLKSRVERASDDVTLNPVLDSIQLHDLQQVVEQVRVSDELAHFIVELVASSRSLAKLQVGASPRGSLAILQMARSMATLDGRDFVIPDDVKRVAVPCLAHRVVPGLDAWATELSSEDIIASQLQTLDVP